MDVLFVGNAPNVTCTHSVAQIVLAQVAAGRISQIQNAMRVMGQALKNHDDWRKAITAYSTVCYDIASVAISSIKD